MPNWVINLTTFPAFNLGFSVMFWALLVLFPIVAIIFLIKKI